MKGTYIIPIDPIDKVTNLELERIVSDKLHIGITITEFTVIEIRNQSVSELTSYLAKNLSNIDCILLTSIEIITCKFK